MGKIVSIRCRRHRKRINVRKEWLKTCGWLCPQCFHKLTKEQRKEYAPQKGEVPEVREAEAGKPVMECKAALEKRIADGVKKVPQKKKEEASLCSLIGAYLDKRETSAKPKRVRKEQVEPKEEHKVSVRLSDVLPRYKIQCRKCGETVPCHGIWFQTSKYLCPECVSKMTDAEVADFNQRAEYPNMSVFNASKEIKPYDGDSDAVCYGGRRSERFIRNATEQELMDAVEQGRLSSVRYRIEMRRRANPIRYLETHDEDEVGFGSR